jgi:hypothetical protein
MTEPRPQRHAILARDAATARLRRLSLVSLALAAGGAAAVGGYAASTTHSRPAGRRVAAAPATATGIPAVPAPAATTPVAGAAPAPAAQSPAPVATSAPPVVVSGGS